MSNVGRATGSTSSVSSAAVAEPEVKTQEPKSQTKTDTTSATQTTPQGNGAVERRAENTIRGTQIAADLNKQINPNAPSFEHIKDGGAVARQGQSGGSVSDIQKSLNLQGAKPPLEETGKFDYKTESAVREFQQKNSLPSDGRVGPETLKKLVPTADTMSQNPEIKKLDPAVQKEVLDQMRKGSDDPAVRMRVLNVASELGFPKLGATQQREMLGVLDKAPKDAALGSNLQKLVKSENFQKLDPSMQSHGLAQIANHVGDKAAVNTLTKLQTSDGFQQLNKTEQERLLTLVGGKNEIISKPAREALETTMKGQTFKGKAEDQAKELKNFLDKQEWPDWQTPADAWNGRTSSPDSVKGPESVKTSPFRYHTGEADQYTVKYGSKEIPVLVPAGTSRADVDKLIGTMNALPEANRKMIDKIVMEKKDHPNGENLFDVKDGLVTAYPMGVNMEPPSRRMSAMVHETAHLVDSHLQKKLGKEKWDGDWRKAMQDDKLKPSQYGKKSEGEDFAEAYLLYKLHKGKPEFEEFRKMYPNRFKIIDDIEQKTADGTL